MNQTSPGCTAAQSRRAPCRVARLSPPAPTRRRQGPTAKALSEIVLPDHEGRERRLGDFWRDGAAVLVWLRHYG
jgi:hypothetical protein